jgi:hypothetical protein
MAITYTWDVSNCEVYPAKSGKSNVIHTVKWKLTGTDDSNNDSDGNPQTACTKGRQALNTDDLSGFVNWTSLKASDVQGFVESALGSTEVAALKTKIDSIIAEQVTPTSVEKILT